MLRTPGLAAPAGDCVLETRRLPCPRPLTAGRDHRCGWATDVDRGAPSPRTPGCDQYPAGPSPLGAGSRSQGPGRSRVRCTGSAVPAPAFLLRSPRALSPAQLHVRWVQGRGGAAQGRQRGRESCRNPLSWPIRLAAPPGPRCCNLGNKQVPEAGGPL